MLKPSSSRWLEWWETLEELCFWRIGTIAFVICWTTKNMESCAENGFVRKWAMPKNSASVRNSNRKIMMLNAVEWIPHVRTKPEIVQKNVMFSNERGNLTKEWLVGDSETAKPVATRLFYRHFHWYWICKRNGSGSVPHSVAISFLTHLMLCTSQNSETLISPTIFEKTPSAQYHVILQTTDGNLHSPVSPCRVASFTSEAGWTCATASNPRSKSFSSAERSPQPRSHGTSEVWMKPTWNLKYIQITEVLQCATIEFIICYHSLSFSLPLTSNENAGVAWGTWFPSQSNDRIWPSSVRERQ